MQHIKCHSIININNYIYDEIIKPTITYICDSIDIWEITLIIFLVLSLYVLQTSMTREEIKIEILS